MTRPVMVFKWWRAEDAKYNVPFEKVEVGAGNFHQFGCDYEETNDGVGAYTTAVVEMPEGDVVNVPVSLIRFDD